MLALARSVAAILVALLVGFGGLSLAMSDLGPGENYAQRLGVSVLYFLVVGLIVGLIDRRRWPLASLAAWGPMLMGGFGLLSKVVGGGEFPYWPFVLVLLSLPLACALFGGWLGSRLRRRRRGLS